jgi:preprotein translocase subunit SecA
MDAKAAAVAPETLPVVITPTQQYRRVTHRKPAPLLKGLDAVVHGMAGVWRRRSPALSELQKLAKTVDQQAPRWQALTDQALHVRLMEFRERFRRHGRAPSEEALGEALGAIREAAHRKLGLRPFLVQLVGALALHRGYLAEMATGEGKTLTAGLAAVLEGWTTRPCHIITVNDYLVQRDSDWIRPLYTFCGVRVGRVTAGMEPAERHKGYAADVTYVTSKELLADFLRDRLRLGARANPSQRLLRELLNTRVNRDPGLVTRGLHSAIVDEADSVLIDEAVTPLIISSPRKNELLCEAVRTAQNISAGLVAGEDYELNHRYREAELTRHGREKVSSVCGRLPGLWRGRERRDEILRQALVAREFFQHGQQYVMHEGRIIIVDEATGRQMPQRTWRQGLHQAIEAKEGLEISDPSETVARLSFQRFFRCFHRLAGMTGTAREAAGEFWHIYRLPVILIPTNRPCQRKQLADRVFSTQESKWQAVVAEVERIHASGRPILVGTRSVSASEHLAELLAARGLDFRLLNAVRHAEEAAIVAMAGEPGRITIATNMAGRGTDIKLGDGIAALGGLHVLATERHESGRVDRQLFGRAARQGDPGSAAMFVSVQDDLIRRYLPNAVRTILQRNPGKGNGEKPALTRAAFQIAQRKAQSQAFKQRKAVLRADTWLEEALSFSGGTGL